MISKNKHVILVKNHKTHILTASSFIDLWFILQHCQWPVLRSVARLKHSWKMD